MILESSNLHFSEHSVSMVDGCFDPLHDGHILYFQQAREQLGLPVCCVLAPDEYVEKKHRVLLPQAQRAKVIEAIRYIDFVVLSGSSTAEMLQSVRPKFYVKGDDWRDRLPELELQICDDLDIEIVYLDAICNSSSKLIADFISKEHSYGNKGI